MSIVNKMDRDRREADSRHRAERRRDEVERQKDAQAQKVQPARKDGKPLYFFVPPATVEGGVCYHCEQNGLTVRHKFGHLFMNDPANPPVGRKRGECFTLCRHHLPDDAVIFNPQSGRCQNKEGHDLGVDGNG